MEIESYGSVRESEICRTCLLELVDDSKIFYLDTVVSLDKSTTIRHKLRDCIPELDLNVTPNAAICLDCLCLINSSHNFKKKCLQTEKSIKKFIRRMGSIFVDLAQLVEQNKKSHLYPDIPPFEIKQEPGIAESHAYTRFFVTQQPLETSTPDIYQEKNKDVVTEMQATKVVTEMQPPQVVTEIQPIKVEPIQNITNIKLILPPNGPVFVKAPPEINPVPPLQKLEIEHAPSPPIEKMQNTVKEELLENCAITLKDMPKSNPFKMVDYKPRPLSRKFDSLNTNGVKQPKYILTKKDIVNDENVSYVKPQAVRRKVIKPNTNPMNNQKHIKLEMSNVITTDLPQKLTTSGNIHNLQRNSDSSNLVYAILTLVKPQSETVLTKPELAPVKVDPKPILSGDLKPVLGVVPNLQVKPEIKTIQKPEVREPALIKIEPTASFCNPSPLPLEMPEVPTPTESLISVAKTSTLQLVTEKESVLPVTIKTELLEPASVNVPSSPPPLVQISDPPNLVKTEPDVPADTAATLGYKVSIDNLPPLVPIQSDDEPENFEQLECTPNIADYVTTEYDDGEELQKCNDCQFECKDKSELMEHMSEHLDEKPKSRDLFGRIKTLGGKLVYDCQICNYRTALKRRYLFHIKLHEENKLLKCTLCNYLCATKSNLNVHMAVHTGHKPHKCAECGYSTVSKSALLVHSRIHTGDRPYSCGVCGYCTISKSALIVHNRIHTGSKPYRCPTCNYRTITKSSLTVHMRTHTGDKPFKCHLCEYSTRAKSALNVHVRIHEGYKPYQCTECEYRCSQRSGLNVHMRIHTGDKPFQCTECDYKCSNKSSLVVHNRTHTGETPYKCDECDYTTAWKSALNVHSRIHGDRKPFRCTECEYKCAQRSTLNVHMRIHTGDKPYQCTECEYRCRYQGNLKIHMRIHTRETPFQCSLCNYCTTAKSALIVHNRIHTGEKPFKCTECPYKCSTKSSLKIHSRTHTGETPYQCKRCLYKASSNSALKVHLRIHTGEKPYKCTYCSYKASNKGSIKVHLRVHTGETPYECSICDYKTTAKSALIVHMRIHTGDKPYKCEECSYRCNNRSSLKVHLKVHTGRTPYRCEICDYRCKKKFVLKRHLRVHRKEGEVLEYNDDSGDGNERDSLDNMVVVKSESDPMVIGNDSAINGCDESEEREEAYDPDLEVSNIQPEFTIVAI